MKFFLFYLLCKYILLIMLLHVSHFFLPFITLHLAVPSPPAFPPYFRSMGHTYKFFDFFISYTILNFPLSILYLPLILLISRRLVIKNWTPKQATYKYKRKKHTSLWLRFCQVCLTTLMLQVNSSSLRTEFQNTKTHIRILWRSSLPFWWQIWREIQHYDNKLHG